MPTNQPTPVLPLSTPALAPDSDFEARWAAWVVRGQLHNQRVRRKLVMVAGAFVLGAVLVYALVRA